MKSNEKDIRGRERGGANSLRNEWRNMHYEDIENESFKILNKNEQELMKKKQEEKGLFLLIKS